MDRSLVESKLALLRQQAREQEDQLNATLGAVQVLEQLLVEAEAQPVPLRPEQDDERILRGASA